MRDPDVTLKVDTVKDVWLTGYDVHSLHPVHVDEPMSSQILSCKRWHESTASSRTSRAAYFYRLANLKGFTLDTARRTAFSR